MNEFGLLPVEGVHAGVEPGGRRPPAGNKFYFERDDDDDDESLTAI